MGAIEGLDAALTQHLTAIHQTATSVPAGGGPAWDALLRHYGIAPLGDHERRFIVQHMRLARGAVPAEVRVVFTGLHAWAQRELDSARGDPAAAGFAARLATLVDQETAKYEASLGLAPLPPLPPPTPAAPSLASIFSNAQTTSKEVPWAGQTFKQVGSLTCIHCGGPQEQPLDFMCRYCRRPIAG
jgi:hypothetical protein